MTTEKFRVTGMTCAACQANVTRRVQKLSGVQEVDVSLLKNQMQVTFDESAVAEGDICAAVTEIGYGAEPAEAPAPPGGDGSGRDFQSQWKKRQQDAEEEQAAMKKRLTLSVILLVPLMYVAMGAMMGLPVPSFLIGMENALISALTQLLITLPILVLNRKFYTGGLRSLWKRSPNMDSLVAVGSGASLLYGIFALYRMAWGFGHGDMALVHQYAHDLYFESSAMIVTLVTVGKYLESRSKAKTSGALDKLVDLAPKTATVLREGAETVIPAQQVQAGDIVVIRPGESLPVDGVVTEGHGYVDQSAITGESLPVERGPGDPVLSATINKNGSFQFRASKVGDDTTLAQIIRLVDEAGSTKAPIARLADKISGVFVPIVMVIALVTAIVWLIAGQTFEFSLSCAIAVLVISCPCALGLATPVAIMVGTGKAAEYGILVKSAESLENLHRVDTIVLDKTGTLTSGKPAVTDVQVLDAALSPTNFLALAAALETGSEHPLAQAVTEYAKSQGITPYKAEDFSATAGRGVQAKIQGELCLAGNLAFLREQGIEADSAAAQGEALARQGKTPLFFVKAGKLAGVIAVADSLRESSLRAVERFHKMGLQVVMLTGDNKATAQAIRQQAGIEEAVSDVLPAEKEAVIRRLQGENRRVAMVGDGINDAPALTRADIGIAIGAGTDIAIDSADVVLMKNSLEDVCTAIELSKSVIRNIRMNLFWAFFYNVLGIPVAAGLLWPLFAIKLSPMLGSAAMSLSSVCVVANALRLRFFKDKARISPQTASPVETPILNTTVEGANTMKKVLTVEGMMCAHCQSHVQKALEGVTGVTAVNVDLEAKKATVEMAEDVADELLAAAVKDAGYEPVDCKAV
ncbi:MAG: heavy metal translocating P-type ATPase [Acutalibacter sp.]|nr:heavy metal translocating P-type ATPase [Acutalibacter sp.]